VSDPGPEPETAQLDIHPEDPDDDWSGAHARSGFRLHTPTAVLLGLLVLAGGFWGGAMAEKHHSPSSSASSTLSALASRVAAARSASSASGAGSGAGAGFAGGAGAGAGGGGSNGGAGAGGSGGGRLAAATAGIVTGVQGNILYVTNASGNLVKVNVGPSATVTRTSKSSLAGLQTGDTVVVQGSTASGGTVDATSVRATAQGVSAAGGGFAAAFGNPGGG
jgi:hypothetical protein